MEKLCSLSEVFGEDMVKWRLHGDSVETDNFNGDFMVISLDIIWGFYGYDGGNRFSSVPQKSSSCYFRMSPDL